MNQTASNFETLDLCRVLCNQYIAAASGSGLSGHLYLHACQFKKRLQCLSPIPMCYSLAKARCLTARGLRCYNALTMQ